MRSSISACRSAIGPVRFANVAKARGESILFGSLATQQIADEFHENLIPKVAMLGSPTLTTAILRQLAELARYLRTNGSNIWYSERLKLPWWELLHREHWEAIVESVGEAPGRGKALLNARRYLFLRATAQPTRALPKQWKVLADGYDAADL